jgi:UDP-N-acetyl-D-mannosaminuronate dehydrogenase
VLDPHFPDERIARHGFDSAGAERLGEYDLAAILTDHADLPYEAIAAEIPLVFDSRGVYRRLGLEVSNVEAL